MLPFSNFLPLCTQMIQCVMLKYVLTLIEHICSSNGYHVGSILQDVVTSYEGIQVINPP